MSELKFKFKMPDDESLAGYISVKGEKGDKGDPTKLSELENDTDFVNADTSRLTHYYTKTQTDSAINTEVSALNVPEGFFRGTEVVSGQGTAITLDSTASASISEVKLYGDMVQAGTPTPTPDSPVAIQVATGVQTVTVSDGDSQTQSYEIDLGDLELCILETCQDYIYKDYIYKDYTNSKWYKKKSVEKLNISGLTGWYYSNSTNFKTTMGGAGIGDFVFPANNNTVGLIVSDKYKAYAAGKEVYQGTVDYGIALSADMGIAVRNKDITSVSDFNTYLANNQLYAYVALTNPADVEITDEALIEQLEALSKAYSYDGTTNIVVSGSLPVLLYVEAFKNDWSGTVAGVNKELADLDNKKADKADTYTKDEVDTKLDDSYIIEDITVNEYYDEQRLTHYYVAHIPHIDSDGNVIKMKLGTANDVEDEGLRVNETPSSFAKRHKTTLAISAGIFNAYSNSAYYKYPLGVVIKDRRQICDFRDVIWNENVASHSYLQKNRMLGVHPDGSLERFDYNATASDILNAGVEYTVTGFGALLQNGEPTNDRSQNNYSIEVTYEETEDETPNINKIYFTLVEGKYIGHWRLEAFEAGTTYYEQATADFYQWHLLGQNTTTKDYYVFSCNGKGKTTELGMSLEQAVAVLQGVGCDYAFQLDGGGSVSVIFKGERITNKTDGQTIASSKTDGRGLIERELPTFLYWAKEPTTGADKNIADIYKQLNDLSDKVYDLDVVSTGNETVNNSALFIENNTNSDSTDISFRRNGAYAVTLVADYNQEGIWALWDNRLNKTVMRIYPNADDGIAYDGKKLSLITDEVSNMPTAVTDLNDLSLNPNKTGMWHMTTQQNTANQPYTGSETYDYYIWQFGQGSRYTQIAIPQVTTGDISKATRNTAIKMRNYKDGTCGDWVYLNRTPAVSTAYRPTVGLSNGLCVFDYTLKKPIWYYEGSWYDATGTVV